MIDTIELIDVAIVEAIASRFVERNFSSFFFFFSINKNKGAVSSEDC